MERCTRYNIIVIKIFGELTAGQWFSPGTPVSSTNKIDFNDVTEILLRVALNTMIITHTLRLV
jgi:hypothetical protein